jgi:hypothetical protein
MTITNRLTIEDTQKITTSHLRHLSPLWSVETTTVSFFFGQNQDSLEDSSFVVFVQLQYICEPPAHGTFLLADVGARMKSSGHCISLLNFSLLAGRQRG